MAKASKGQGDFERFFDSRTRVETDYWRVRFYAAVNYYGDRERTMLAAVKRAVRAGGGHPWRFLTALEKGIDAEYRRNPSARQVAVLAWLERVEEIERQLQEFLAQHRAPAGA